MLQYFLSNIDGMQIYYTLLTFIFINSSVLLHRHMTKIKKLVTIYLSAS